MGNWKSKPSVKPPEGRSPQQINEYEDVELVLLRTAIVRDPKSFILNNLMMCIQFFENYEEDRIQIKETLASSYEAKLNKILPPQKHVLLPDILQEYMAHNIIFTSKRQTGDLIIEPLQPIRIYVVHNNIEITEHHYQPEYSSLNNGITYNLMVQPSEHPGYVRLQRLDETPYPRNLSKQEDLSLMENDDEIYNNDGESIYGHNSNMILPHQRKKIRSLQLQSTIINNGSLSNIHNDKIYGNRESLLRKNIYKTQSNYDIKTKSECEHMFSMENRDKKTSKSELDIRNKSYQQQLLRPDTVKSTKPKVDQRHHRRPPSISSSGYRSGAYDSDSDWRDYYTVTPNAQTSNIHENDKMDASSKIYSSDTDAIMDASSKIYSSNTDAMMDASSKIYSNAMIPTQCFKKVRINNEGKIYAMRAERKQLQNSKQIRLRMADRQHDCEVFYMNNKMFMSHFVDLFIYQLAEPLGFKSEDLNYVENSAIHCDKIIESHSLRLHRIESYEVTPTIWLQWPTYAQEWLDRPRSTWPDYNDISKVKDFGCYVIPEGFLPKQRDLQNVKREMRHQNVKRNIQQEIEWQLTFPAAERYLETCMTRSQVQVYLIALMLHKTFLRPVSDSMHGLTTSHIRNKLFWLIEEDDRPSKWPDNRTGECLIKLLNSLYRCISQNEPILPDYFLRDRNMFNEVSSDYLLHSQKQLKRIIENPIMFVFHAMENIKHSNQFFPRLDFAMLFKILTVQPWLAVVNPTLDMPRTAEESHREEIYNRSGGFWDTARMNDQQNYSTRVITNRTLITPRKATDLIVEIEECCAKLEGLRLAALLDFFVRHFIKMAECCHRYRSYQQKKVYLDQADRLSIILSEQTRYKDDAKAYRDKIHALRMRAATNSTRLSNEPPETPKRNGDSIFVGTLKNRYTQQFAEQIVPVQPKGKQSSHEYMSKITKAITHEIRFKDEKHEEKSVKKVNAISNDEDSYTRNVSKSQSDESASGTIQKVISLADHLSETTYI